MAAEVCHKWGIPETISPAIRYHHRPSSSLEVELAFILHLADYIALVTEDRYESEDFLYELEEGTLDYLDLDDTDINDLSSDELTEAVAKMLDSAPEN